MAPITTRREPPAIFLCAALFLGGCHARNQVMQGGTMSGAIGDSTCAMLARLTFTMVDGSGRPVADAEVWQVQEFEASPPIAPRATRLGRSGPAGQYVSSHCFAGDDEVDRWQREPHPTRLSFLVLHDVHGVRRVTAEPPLTEVYSEADIRTARVGRAVNHGYELALRVTF